MTTKPNGPISRRASLKLATAVSTLAAGLGATLDPSEALAGEPQKLKQSKIGALTIKLFKLASKDKLELVDTVELGSVVHKLQKGGSYTIKLMRALPQAEASTLLEQQLTVEKG